MRCPHTVDHWEHSDPELGWALEERHIHRKELVIQYTEELPSHHLQLTVTVFGVEVMVTSSTPAGVTTVP